MSDKAQAKIIAYPKKENAADKAPAEIPPKVATEERPAKDDAAFLDRLAAQEISAESLQRELRRVLSEIDVLRSENRWEDLLTLFHPVEEKLAELQGAGLAGQILGEVAFALGQLGRFDEAIEVCRRMVEEAPDDFYAHARLAYIAYNSLYAAKTRRIVLHPAERKARIELAHKHFAKAQVLKPERVTNYYRQGMLYKSFQNKKDRALPLFETAVRNWEAYAPEEKQARHQERKNYVKSLYQLASCHLDQGRADAALETLSRCLKEDQTSGYISLVHKYFALGKIHFQSGDLEKAEQALAFAAGQADPQQNEYVFELLARVQLAHGRTEKAKETLARIPPPARKPYVLWTEADILAVEGRSEQARAVLKKAAERDRRGRHKALIRLVRLEYRLERFAESLRWADEANRFFQGTYQNPCMEAIFWRAAALYRLGRLDEAAASVRELAELNPRYPHLRTLRARIVSAINKGGDHDR